jgi:hypothetical protein
MDDHPSVRVFTLDEGQRRRGKRPTECDECGRAICRNEYYRCTVTLYIYGGRNREVIVRRACACSPY